MVDTTIFQRDQKKYDFGSALVLGLVAGNAHEVKFGYAASINALGDVWPLGTLYAFPVTAGQAVEVVSDNIADAGVMVTVDVINAASGLEESHVVALDGTNPTTNPVLVPGGNVKSVNRAFNANGTTFTGIINVRGTGSPNSTVFAVILPEDQQSTQCPYMVPADKVAIINNYSTALNKTGGVDVSAIMRLIVTRNGKVARTQIRYGIQRGGVSNLSSDLVVPIPVPPLSKIQVTADPSAVADISGEYSMILIDKTLVPASILAAIEAG